jgi:twitching motility two-component system response regulator PilH
MKTKVLLIDDDETTRYLFEKLLRDTDIELLTADSGAAGVRLAQSEQPRVVLLDYTLRDETVFDVLDQLAPIPVVIHTARDLDDTERARLQRAAAFVPKRSLSRETAIALIQEALRATSGSD